MLREVMISKMGGKNIDEINKTNFNPSISEHLTTSSKESMFSRAIVLDVVVKFKFFYPCTWFVNITTLWVQSITPGNNYKKAY